MAARENDLVWILHGFHKAIDPYHPYFDPYPTIHTPCEPHERSMPRSMGHTGPMPEPHLTHAPDHYEPYVRITTL